MNFLLCVNVSQNERFNVVKLEVSLNLFFLVEIQCGFPAEISNGSYKLINGTINYLSQVQYSCVDGFKINGRDRLICDLDERWDGPPPKCTGKNIKRRI